MEVFVRLDGFKLEGGELFKEGFRKLLNKEWNYFKKQMIRNSVCQNNKQKQQHQKNNWLFIPVCKYQNWI